MFYYILLRMSYLQNYRSVNYSFLLKRQLGIENLGKKKNLLFIDSATGLPVL